MDYVNNYFPYAPKGRGGRIRAKNTCMVPLKWDKNIFGKNWPHWPYRAHLLNWMKTITRG